MRLAENAGPACCLAGGFALALGQDGLEELQVLGMVPSQVLAQFRPRHDLAYVDDQLQQVCHVLRVGRAGLTVRPRSSRFGMPAASGSRLKILTKLPSTANNGSSPR